MLKPPTPIDEEERIQTFHNLNILDLPAEECFECITRVRKPLFDAAIAMSLIDENRQWFKYAQGLTACETNRDTSFCGVILRDGLFEAPDSLKAPFFADKHLDIKTLLIGGYFDE